MELKQKYMNTDRIGARLGVPFKEEPGELKVQGMDFDVILQKI